jgi:hypothetical protein
LSISWQLDVEPRPALLVLPPAAESLDEADAAIELWEHYSRKVLDPAQRLTVEVVMAQAGDGRWAAATTGREMPRQNGKGDEIEVVELWGLVQRGEAILHTVHDAVLLASQAQQRMLGVLEGHADLRRLVKRKWQGTGQQMIEMRNGGVIWYRTRSGGGGRGVDDVDRLVVDEAQHATEEHLAAVAPTLLANSNPQMNAMGTSGLAGKSEWWWSMRRRALDPDPGAFGYVGHTAECVHLDADGRVVQPPVDIEDRALWVEANPSLAAGRGQGLEFLEEQLRRLGPGSFAREHLGVWDPPESLGGSDIDMTVWAQLEDMEDTRPSPVAFSVAVSADRQWSSIGLAGLRTDGHRHVQIVQAGRSTGWVPARLAELVKLWKPVGVAIEPGGPAGALIGPIEAAGVKLTRCGSREYAQACGLLIDGMRERTIRHTGQPQLNVAVGAARKVTTKDDAQAFDGTEGTDIAPLRAAALALYAFERSHAKKRTGVVV